MKIGTCGFCESRSQYFQDFCVIELQKTFYDFVKEEWLKKLRNQSNKDFEFTFKAIQIISHNKRSPTYRRFRSIFGNPDNYGHFKPTEEVYSAMEKMIVYASILNANKIIIQAPPDFSENEENIKNLYEFFRKFSRRSVKYCLEIRGKWNENTLKTIMEEFGIVHVVDLLKNKSLNGEFKYYRLHGKTGYSYFYNEGDLIYLKQILNENDYTMFNNTHMCENAKTFQEMLKNDIKNTCQGNTIR